MVEHAALIELVSIIALLRQDGDTAALEFEKFGLDRAGNGRHDFILQFEQVSAATVISLCPEMGVGFRVNQLGGNADVVP